MKRVLIIYAREAIGRCEMERLGEVLLKKWNIEAIILRSSHISSKDFTIYDIDKLEEGEIEGIKLLIEASQRSGIGELLKRIFGGSK